MVLINRGRSNFVPESEPISGAYMRPRLKMVGDDSAGATRAQFAGYSLPLH